MRGKLHLSFTRPYILFLACLALPEPLHVVHFLSGQYSNRLRVNSRPNQLWEKQEGGSCKTQAKSVASDACAVSCLGEQAVSFEMQLNILCDCLGTYKEPGILSRDDPRNPVTNNPFWNTWSHLMGLTPKKGDNSS